MLFRGGEGKRCLSPLNSPAIEHRRWKKPETDTPSDDRSISFGNGELHV